MKYLNCYCLKQIFIRQGLVAYHIIKLSATYFMRNDFSFDLRLLFLFLLCYSSSKGLSCRPLVGKKDDGVSADLAAAFSSLM